MAATSVVLKETVAASNESHIFGGMRWVILANAEYVGVGKPNKLSKAEALRYDNLQVSRTKRAKKCW